ncbi:outer membrane protein [Oceanicola sp. S124]|uniref:outer membrane protein n=1 Tax=Oceanicola sp. S124 TaxID=1042378 RepID=UPI000255A692|nr:outer membrane beta-barrel protein [Oceanicola sp. S124]
MFRNTMIAAVAASAVAVPAFAGAYTEAPADPVVATPAPVYTAGTDWTGGYVGAQLGYGNVDVNGVGEEDGAVYGVQGGYDYDFGTFVLGGEVDYVGAEDGILAGADLDSMTRIKLKAGYDAGPALIYGVIGAAYANTSAGDDNGMVYGVGADYMVNDTVSVGAEYLYHEFEDFNGSGTDIDAGTLAARVNYRF